MKVTDFVLLYLWLWHQPASSQQPSMYQMIIHKYTTGGNIVCSMRYQRLWIYLCGAYMLSVQQGFNNPGFIYLPICRLSICRSLLDVSL